MLETYLHVQADQNHDAGHQKFATTQRTLYAADGLRLKTLHMQRLSHLQQEDVAGSTKGNSPNQHGLKGWQCTLK